MSKDCEGLTYSGPGQDSNPHLRQNLGGHVDRRHALPLSYRGIVQLVAQPMTSIARTRTTMKATQM